MPRVTASARTLASHSENDGRVSDVGVAACGAGVGVACSAPKGRAAPAVATATSAAIRLIRTRPVYMALQGLQCVECADRACRQALLRAPVVLPGVSAEAREPA